MAVLLNRPYSQARSPAPSYKQKKPTIPKVATMPATGWGNMGAGLGVAASTPGYGKNPITSRPDTKIFIDRTTSPMSVGGSGAGAAALIGGDYGVAEMESLMNARMGRAKGDFTSQLRQMLIDLGVVDKTKLGNLGQYIDADTIKKAAENKYSQTAQISQQETARRAQSEADLAARGMLSSGQLTTDTERTLAEGESARYGALRDFLSGGAQGLSQLADMNFDMAMQLAQARSAAAERAAMMQYYLGMGGDDGTGAGAGGGTYTPHYVNAPQWRPGQVVPDIPVGLQPGQHGAGGFGNYDYMRPVSSYGKKKR
jgi:hypothetical protein